MCWKNRDVKTIYLQDISKIEIAYIFQIYDLIYLKDILQISQKCKLAHRHVDIYRISLRYHVLLGMAKFSLSFHFNSFSYLCVALYIHFPQSPFALIALVPVSMASDPYNTVETKAIHHTDTQDPIRTRSNTITTTNQRDTTARNLATVINLMAMIIRNQLSYEYSPPSYGYDKKPSGYEYQPSPYGYDKYDKKLSYDYSPPSLTMHRRRLFRVYGFAFQ